MAPTPKKQLRKSVKAASYSTPALEKGLDVLELLARQSAGLTKSQVARELARTPSEIFRMLLCLERRGYIAPVADERYSLTLKLFQLVQEHPPIERLIADALPVMARLANETGQSCHLGVLESGNLVILAQTNAPTNVGFYVKMGSSVDMLDAASGYVILAYLDVEARARMLSKWTRTSGKQPPTDLDLHLKRIRAAGCENRESYLVKGVVNISFPVLDDRGFAVAALTVPYLQYAVPMMKPQHVKDLLKQAAMQITAAIGGRTTGL